MTGMKDTTGQNAGMTEEAVVVASVVTENNDWHLIWKEKHLRSLHTIEPEFESEISDSTIFKFQIVIDVTA